MRVAPRYLAGLALAAAIALAPCRSAAAEGATAGTEPAAFTLPCNSLRLELTSPSRGLRLRSLVDVASGTEFVPQAGEGLSLWEVVLLRLPERRLAAVAAGPGASFAARSDDAGALEYRLTWPSVDLPDEPGALGVEVRIAVPRGEALSYWSITVTNRSTAWAAWQVRYPRLERLGPLGAPEADLLLDPMTQGRLTPNPYRHLPTATRTGDTQVLSAGLGVHYPGYASFQMCSLYHVERAGLYYAAYDGQGYYKRFCFGPQEEDGPLDLYLEHSPEGQGLPGTGYVSPFPVALGAFQGDWFTAARIYRGWAEKQVWCSRGKTANRADVAPWYKSLAVWEFITANSYEAMHYYRGLLGVPWANHWNYLWKDASQGDRGSPDLFPPKGGEGQMRAETAKLTEAGVYTVPYFLGSAVDVRSPQYAEWQMDPVLVRGGEAQYALGNPDTPYIWVYGPEVQFAWPCPFLDFWPDKAVDIVRRIMELGATGVYLDTTTGNGYQCFSRSHGHPVGGGSYWAQGNRRYLRRVRDTIKAINPAGIMTGENPCEIYNDLMDGYLLYVAHFPTHVPAFQAIYHDYIGTYGQFLATAAQIGVDYPLQLPLGICFINGDQFGCTARTDYTLQAQGAADLAWLRRLAHFRVKVVNRYVGLGEMLRPPLLETRLPEVSGWWQEWSPKPWITRTVTRPAVIHSAWRAADGSVGVVFLNLSEQPQQVAFSLHGDEYGFVPGDDLAVAILGLDRAEQPTREPQGTLAGGQGRLTLDLEPRGMRAFELAPPPWRTP